MYVFDNTVPHSFSNLTRGLIRSEIDNPRAEGLNFSCSLRPPLRDLCTWVPHFEIESPRLEPPLWGKTFHPTSEKVPPLLFFVCPHQRLRRLFLPPTHNVIKHKKNNSKRVTYLVSEGGGARERLARFDFVRLPYSHCCSTDC